MEASDTLNLLAVIISFFALTISGVLALRQTSTMRHSNAIPVIVEIMQEFRSETFQKAESYVLTELARDHDPAGGWSRLPDNARTDVNNVSSFFGSLGVLVSWGIIDEWQITSQFGYRARRAWQVLQPYIYEERDSRDDKLCGRYYEYLICRIEKNLRRPHPRVRRLVKARAFHSDGHG